MVKPGRHRQPDAAHLGEVGALAAEQRLHRAVAVGLAAEEIDVFAGRRGFRPCGLRRSRLPLPPLARQTSLRPSPQRSSPRPPAFAGALTALARPLLFVATRSAAVFFAISTSVSVSNLRDVRDPEDQIPQRRHQRQAARRAAARLPPSPARRRRTSPPPAAARRCRRTPRDSRRAAAAVADPRRAARRALPRSASSAGSIERVAHHGACGSARPRPCVMFLTRLSSAATPSSAARPAHLRQRLELAPRLERADALDAARA